MPYLRRHCAAVIALLIALGAVVTGILAGGGKMFSPGPLNARTRPGVTLGGVTSHADLGGNCAACHAAPWGRDTMATRCLDCHSDIRADLDAHHSLHGHMADGTQCRTCHTEHKGAHGTLTSFARFDHDMTAFKLTGKHTAVDCKSCHVSDVFKGTSPSCASCHAEPKVHTGKFGTDCASCHSTNTWTAPTVDKSFNHDLAAFKLTGKHQAVDCKSCHVNGVYKGTSQACVSCHAEPKVHTGKFGTACASCHSTNTWEGASFKHTFPINHGKGKPNACATCHKAADDYKSYTCYGCHEHEPTRIQRKHKNVVNLDNCVKCHKGGRGKGERGARDRDDGPESGLCCAGEEACDGCPGQGRQPASQCCGADDPSLRHVALADRVIDGMWGKALHQSGRGRGVRPPAVQDDPCPLTADRHLCDNGLAALPGATRRRGRRARTAYLME